MFFRAILLFFLFVSFTQCAISLRVYRPFPMEEPFEFIQKFPNIQVLVTDENPAKMAEYDGYFFEADGLQNEYGPLSYLIRKELSIRSNLYPKLLEKGGKIEVKEFLLHSLDRCSKNRVEVSLKANLQIAGGPIETFEYSDFIESKVTNCYLTGSSLLILPLLWYVPYNGFRGNREDQLNLLGRNALEEFFRFIEMNSALNKNGKPDIQEPKKKDTKAKKLPEPIDPKIKDIMDSL
ncbi:MAG: hypothetical protein MUF77_11760 [Leptospira sp.]|jgi:hypothetical protein|nr:hypothetical protein [Leptospira sp.]